ncbi:hypothetical protein P153DRAFT_430253 [Dothidotthia symphoricarpi CBS 119687]|uniref:Uncharacterized protein n=1 Tax=Dothidotthia symphoricarpi CBS 119687 TaxID=1392245 RepID=A0A6A6AGD4_9PLEO|nr:uncharacterized protein P153DRAFT_430253 [Dothidotthia symphoricarpi CBS 119687]KAF2130979.1 hypothetical protein P153DRAFT_430253 [Dothidotthia symphoricarpi CBS 119687]
MNRMGYLAIPGCSFNRRCDCALWYPIHHIGEFRMETSGASITQSIDRGFPPTLLEATDIANPKGGRLEVSEPNFTSTNPCQACSPFIEIPATGWVDSHSTEQQGDIERPAQATIFVGSRRVIIIQVAVEYFIAGCSTAVEPGQTVIINNTPVVVQSSTGKVEVIVGTKTIPLDMPIIQVTDASHQPHPITGTSTRDNLWPSSTSNSNLLSSPPSPTNNLDSAADVLRRKCIMTEGWLGGTMILIWCMLWLLTRQL